MNARLYQLDPASLAQYHELRDEAIAATVAASARAAADVDARFGFASPEACAEELDHHLDFLRPTLETDDLSPFLAYLGWWTQVLASRGLTQLALQLALDELASFFIARLGNAALPIAAALGAGRAALAQGISAPTYDK
ncbi:MAG: hypothetical protein Q8M96_07680, partial [Rubrivivax sp.]|nr:hypothetical protein [Rubrivivax sp.]